MEKNGDSCFSTVFLNLSARGVKKTQNDICSQKRNLKQYEKFQEKFIYYMTIEARDLNISSLWLIEQKYYRAIKGCIGALLEVHSPDVFKCPLYQDPLWEQCSQSSGQ